MSHKLGRIFLIIAIICTVEQLFAQSSTVKQVWSDVNLAFVDEDKKINFFGDAGSRLILNKKKGWRNYFRPSLKYFITSDTQIRGGLGVFNTNTAASNQLEVRPFQGFRFLWPQILSWSLKHYIRLEERFFFTENELEFSIRSRYQLGMDISIIESDQYADIYLPMAYEGFYNFNRDNAILGDKMRLQSGIGCSFDQYWALESHLVFERNRIAGDTDFDTENVIIRLRVYRKIL